MLLLKGGTSSENVEVVTDYHHSLRDSFVEPSTRSTSQPTFLVVAQRKTPTKIAKNDPTPHVCVQKKKVRGPAAAGVAQKRQRRVTDERATMSLHRSVSERLAVLKSTCAYEMEFGSFRKSYLHFNGSSTVLLHQHGDVHHSTSLGTARGERILFLLCARLRDKTEEAVCPNST